MKSSAAPGSADSIAAQDLEGMYPQFVENVSQDLPHIVSQLGLSSTQASDIQCISSYDDHPYRHPRSINCGLKISARPRGSAVSQSSQLSGLGI